TTSSLVHAILDSAGPEAFALAIGPQQLAELRADGTLRRRQLRSALSGGVSKLETHISGPKGRLERRFLPVGKSAKPYLYAEEGNYVLGVDLGRPDSRWRLFQGDPDNLGLFAPYIAPAVIVHTGNVPFALPYADYEAAYLSAGATLVLPHSDAADRHVRDVLE